MTLGLVWTSFLGRDNSIFVSMNTKNQFTELGNLMDFAEKVTRDASKIMLQYYLGDLSIEWKPDNSPVTIADKKSEEYIRTQFISHTPHFGIIGEEFGNENENAPWQWTIDPIDGTKAFIHGCPLFGTLIGLLHEGKSVGGLIHLPVLGWTIKATKGGGASLNGASIRVSSCKEISQALLLDGSITTMEKKGYSVPWKNLRQKARLHRGWGDCYGYALVACGRAEAMVDPIVSPWDIAPMPVIFEEAGGQFTDLRGNKKLAADAVASNGAIHREIIQEFSEYTGND